MHFKNFAIFHSQAGMRLKPIYDSVSAALHQYKTMALGIADIMNLRISEITPRHLVEMGKSFGLSSPLIESLIQTLHKGKIDAMNTVALNPIAETFMKDKLLDMMEKRWNGTFALIGKALSKKP